MQIEDLREKNQDIKKDALSQKRLTRNHSKFKVGDVIEFWSGYNDDIRYRTEIVGFNDNDIYVLWDCYWSPIQDNMTTKIVKYNEQ